MSGDDLVDFVIVTRQSNFLAVTMTRQQASDSIKGWYEVREYIRNKSWWKLLWSYVRTFPFWLRPLTFVLNMQLSKDESYGYWAVDPRFIIGMYVRERGQDPYSKLAEAQQKIAQAMMGEVKDLREGEEWKKGYQDEDDE